MDIARRLRLPAGSGISGVTPGAALLSHELRSGTMDTLHRVTFGTLAIELAAGHDALWMFARKAGRGGIAMRIAFFPAGCESTRLVRPRKGESARVEAHSILGVHRVALVLHEGAVPVVRVTTAFEPASLPLLTSFVPRDLYPLGEDDDPLTALGEVEAAQRGFNTGAIYFRVCEPAFGSVLYFQNLTALNPYFRATGTKPDGAVGGIWPEIGFLLPAPPQTGTSPVDPLPADSETVISDALLAFHDEPGGDEQDMARRYLSLLGAVLRHIDLPATEYCDSVWRADRSIPSRIPLIVNPSP